jgi:hypothetical protein
MYSRLGPRESRGGREVKERKEDGKRELKNALSFLPLLGGSSSSRSSSALGVFFIFPFLYLPWAFLALDYFFFCK